MQRLKSIPLLLLVLAGLMACSEQDGTAKATVLYFMEQERGTESSRTRMLVTPDFLRIDDDADGNNFLLFNRRDGVIYTSTDATSRILVIKPKKVGRVAPFSLNHRVERDNTELPPVAGKTVTHYRLLTNDQLCYELSAAEGLLPQALQAMREYREVLAGEQAQSLDWTPKEMLSPCGIANNIFVPVRHLMHGFPIQIKEMTGRSRVLIDYKIDLEVDRQLFELPSSYSRMELDEIRSP